jgi:hypothetical protein
MPRPQSRPITRHPLAPQEEEPVVPTTPSAPVAATPKGKRPGKQLGLRIPDDLYERLLACTEDTGIPQSTLLRRALDKELKTHAH